MKTNCTVCGKEIEVTPLPGLVDYICDSNECFYKSALNDPLSREWEKHNARVELGIEQGPKVGDPMDSLSSLWPE